MSTAKPFDFDLDTEKKWQAAARYEGTQFPVQPPKEKANATMSTLDVTGQDNSKDDDDGADMIASGDGINVEKGIAPEIGSGESTIVEL